MSGMRISELAEQAQVPTSTVRYYERIGLLRPAQRQANGYRVYDEAAAEQLAFIGRAKRMGIPLEEIAKLIELWSSGGCRPLQERIRSFLDGRIGEVRGQLVDLAIFESQLENLLARLVETEQSDGRCELNCACVRLDEVGNGAGGCPKLTEASGGGLDGWAPGLNSAPARSAEWQELLGGARRRERLDLGLRLVFATSPDTTAPLVALCSAEASSYPFMRFTLEVLPGQLVLVVEGPGMSGEVIERLLGCAQERSPR